jgi:hypothetical protein
MKEFTIDGITYKQVQKRTAERMFSEGKTIYIIHCKANPYSPWIQFCDLSQERLQLKDDYVPECDGISTELFRKQINAFEYYNCNSELGTYASYYITE